MRWLAFLCLGLPQGVAAQELAFPGNAALTREVVEDDGLYPLPVGPFAEAAMQTEPVQGRVVQQAWRIDAPGLTTQQIIAPLAEQLRTQEFELLYACITEACGGFDFRFGTPVLPPPEMYVDLGDFRFLAARRDDAVVTLFVSRSARAGFVQAVYAGSAEAGAATGAATAPAVRAAVQAAVLPSDFAAALEQDGHIVLSDLTFATGSSDLGEGPYGSLAQLAEYLSANPGQTVALVGHTDAEGSLDGNIALSRRRAASVLERLVDAYAVDRAQLDAQGMGYLAPIATNLTDAGRDLNRRVEVIVTSTGN